jgi:CDP-glucose 4,6-dehydratase
MNRSFWAGRRVLVTGQTGFKGSWLSLSLAHAGAEIGGFADGVPTEPSLYELAEIGTMLEVTEGDVRDRDRLTASVSRFRPNVVFHLAAQPLVRRSLTEPALTFETNLLGTVNLLEAVRSAEGVQAVVVVTTDKVYGGAADAPFREDHALGGDDPYSASKACAELATAAYRSSYFSGHDSPAVATARAGNVIGGGDWGEDRLLPDLVAALASGEPVQVRYPDAVRPWQHVLNAVEGYAVLAERLCADASFARAWNFGPDPEDARPVAWVAGRFAELWGAELELERPAAAQPHEAPRLELDASRARRLLGWAPRWNLERSLAATVEWHKRVTAGAPAREVTLAQIDSFAAEQT